MNAPKLSILALGATLALAGCSITSTPNPPPTAQAQPAEAAAAPVAGVLAFGQPFAQGSAEVTVAAPQPYTPSASAAGADQAAAVRLDVTIKNVGSEVLDPSLFIISGTSGQTMANQVFDAPDVGMAPSTPILPGAQVVFPVVFSVADPASLTVQAQVGFDEGGIWSTEV